MSSRPAVNTITFESLIQLSWNVLHGMISWISRTSSKMRRICQEMVELSKKLSFLTRPSLRRGTGICFSKKHFSQNYSQHIWIESVFNADSESDTSFELNRSFLTKHRLKKGLEMHKNCIQKSNCLVFSRDNFGFQTF